MHPATASRALNPALPGRIGADTTAKVVRAAEELGYRPDPTARSLRTRRSGFVGVVVPDLTNPVLAPIVRGIEEVLWAADLGCLLADTDNRDDREEALVDELRARRCEGLIIASATRESATVSELARSGPPAVLVTRSTDESLLPLVAGDDATGVDEAVRHLVELGHRRIVHLTGPSELSTTGRRERAYREAMARLLPSEWPHVVHGEGFTVETGRLRAAQLLATDPGVTAVLAGNDMIAIGVYEALAAAALACPAHLSVVGHNDMPFMGHVDPPLTTVAIPQRRVGMEAARTLLTILGGGDPQQIQLLPTTFVRRGSTAPPSR